MAKSDAQQVGYWAFVIAVIVAVLAGLAEGYNGGEALTSAAAVGAALVVLGVIVGWFNVKEKAFMHFMLVAVTLMVGASVPFSLLNPIWVGFYIVGVLKYLAIFVAPAAVLVALKVFWKEASG